MCHLIFHNIKASAYQSMHVTSNGLAPIIGPQDAKPKVSKDGDPMQNPNEKK